MFPLVISVVERLHLFFLSCTANLNSKGSEMKDMMSVELLKQMRMFVGYSQQDLAKATNYSRSYISKIEQGTVEASSIVQWHILQACRRAGMEDFQFAMLKIIVDGSEQEMEELLNGNSRESEKG